MLLSKRTAERAVAVLACALSTFGTPARLAAQQALELHLEVVINERKALGIGTFAGLPGGHIGARRADLAEAGLKAPGTGPDTEMIDVSAIAAFGAVYDEPAQRITFHVTDDALLMPVVIDGLAPDGAPGAAAATKPESASGVALNYLLFGSAQSNGSALGTKLSGASANLDARVFSPYGVFQQTGIVGTTTSREADIVRLDTTYTFTDPDSLMRARLGDFISDGPAWVRPIRIGGAGLARDYTLRSDLVTAAIPVVSGSAAAPSTVDVFVNGVRTFSKDVPAGPYALNNIPGVSGTGNAQIVVRDATGREVQSSLPFFTSAAVLKAGTFDYAASLGYARYGYATSGTVYGRDPVGVAAARYGLTDTVTLQTYEEGGAGLLSLGAGVDANVLGAGVVSLAGRASRLGGATGFQLYGAFQTRIGPVSINGASQRSIGAFNDLVSATAGLDRPGSVRSLEAFSTRPTFVTTAASFRPLRASDRISFGVQGPWTGSSFGISAIRQVADGQPVSRILSANYNQQLRVGWSLFASAFANFSQVRSFGVYAGLNVMLDAESHVAGGVSSAGSSRLATLEAQKMQGAEVGSWGARARVARDDTQQAYGAGASYLTRFGRAAVNADYQGGSSNVSAEFEGAIVAAPGVVAASPRIDDSFAIVRTGIPGVDVTHETRRVGRTDSSGTLVVPGLFANVPNHVSVDPQSLPTTASLTSTEAVVVPAARSGVVIDLGGKSDVAVANVVLRDARGAWLEPGYTGTVEGSKEPFVIGTEGRAYVRGLAASNTLVVDIPGKPCRAAFDYAPQPDRIVEIGPLTCQ